MANATKKMAVVQAHSIASYFPSAFLLFLVSETKRGALGRIGSSLIYVLCFGVFSFTGPFGHRDVSEALSANISLKLTLLFFLPSESPCQRFGLRAACLETAAAFGRSIQDSEDSHGGEKPRERENWSVSLCVAGSTNHPGLRRIAAMTDMFVYVLCWVIFYFLICRTFKHCSSSLEQTSDLSASICLLLFKASPIFHNQNIEYYGSGPTASFGMSLNF